MTRDDAHVALGMKVAGFSNTKIAKAMDGRSPVQVANALARIPDLYDILNGYRDNLKLRKMRALVDAEEALWKRIDAEIPAGAAKDVDALFRAAHAAEKIESNLAGEAQKVEVKSDSTPNVDLRILFQSLGIDGLAQLSLPEEK